MVIVCNHLILLNETSGIRIITPTSPDEFDEMSRGRRAGLPSVRTAPPGHQYSEPFIPKIDKFCLQWMIDELHRYLQYNLGTRI